MHIPGSSFLGAVKQKLRKAPPAEDLQNGEGASPRFPTNHEPGIGPGISQVPETIALATPSPSKNPRGIHEIVNPFTNLEDSKPSQPGPSQPDREVDHPNPQAEPSDPTEISAQSSNGLEADIRPDPQAEPSDPTETSAQSSNGLVADIGAPATPEIADQGAVESPEVESPIEESSPDPENGQFVLREMFARKSVLNPTIKALLERHHPVNTRALNQELKAFARQLGLSPPNE